MPQRAQLGDHPLRLAERIGPDQHATLRLRRQRGEQLRHFVAVSGWRNTGRPNVASVMKISHGTGSNGAQVGSARRL